MAIWRQLIILICIGGLAFGGYEFWRSEYGGADGAAEAPRGGPRAAAVEIAAIRSATLERTVEAVGTTRARQSVEVRPLAAGRIVELAINPGELVEAGAALARLDDEIERANFAEAEALIVEQRQAAERAQSLRRSAAVAESAVEQAISRLAVAEATLNRARRRLADRTIRAPFAGMIGLTNVDIGARVDDGDVIARLDDLSEIEVEFSLPETLYAEIRVGMPIYALSAAFPGRAFTGEIAAIDSRVDPVGRAFKVRATIPNPERELPAGMFMSLSVTLSATEALVAPEEAIVAQAADTYVFVVEDGKARRAPVRTGLRKAGEVAILSGVAEGDMVVTRGLQSVRDGGAVNVVGGAEQAEPKS